MVLPYPGHQRAESPIDTTVTMPDMPGDGSAGSLVIVVLSGATAEIRLVAHAESTATVLDLLSAQKGRTLGCGRQGAAGDVRRSSRCAPAVARGDW